MAKHASAATGKLSEPDTPHDSGAAVSDQTQPESPATGEESRPKVASPTPGAGESSVTTTPSTAEVDEEGGEGDPDADDTADFDAEESAEGEVRKRRRISMSPLRAGLLVVMLTIVALGALGGWLGYHDYQSHKAQQQRDLFLKVGRQGALNLTTIDWEHADGDVQRILGSATGTFYEDFSNRAQVFVDFVKQAKSKSVGTITEAALESESGNEAQVMVAVSVRTTNAAAPEQDPRAWRMRISVQRVGNEAKVSNVAFVP